jgi:hypothetical protein
MWRQGASSIPSFRIQGASHVTVSTWRHWAKEGIQTKVGRWMAFALGVATFIWVTVLYSRGQVYGGFAGVVAPLGLMLAGVAALGPMVKRWRIGEHEIETRDPTEAGQLTAELDRLRQEVSEDPDSVDPATIDLPGDDLWDGARYRLGERAIPWLLTNLGGDLAGCEGRIFLFDRTAQKLMPAFRPATAHRPAFGWAIGQGVTGAAYERGVRVLATGEATHDDTFNLTDEMKRRYSDLTAVAAAPLVDRNLNVIGALSLSSKDPQTRLISRDAEWQHFDLAVQVSVALVDLLRATT